jgi:methyltransferase (TIGR00027 family)
VSGAGTKPIRHVSDTALWVAIYRAMESERPDAIFRDPHARRLAGTRGEEIVRTMPRGRSWAWPMIVRTAVMDEIVLRCVGEGAGAVINLAAGLDTRPYRLDLPATLPWFHVDLPDMVAFMQEQMAGEKPRCRLEHASVDLTQAERRRDVFARAAAAAGGKPVFAMSEGLLIYLTPDQVTDLARGLLAEQAIRWWMTDLASPGLLKMMEKNWGRRVSEGNAPFRFAPADGTAFFERAGWKEREYYSMWEESLRLKRTMPMAWLWQLIGRLYPERKRKEFRRFSGIVVLGRA